MHRTVSSYGTLKYLPKYSYGMYSHDLHSTGIGFGSQGLQAGLVLSKRISYGNLEPKLLLRQRAAMMRLWELRQRIAVMRLRTCECGRKDALLKIASAVYNDTLSCDRAAVVRRRELQLCCSEVGARRSS